MNRHYCWLLSLALTLTALAPLFAQGDGRLAAENLAAGKSVTFNTPPSYPDVSDAGDAAQLTDGQFSPATPIWYDKATVGWVLTDPTVFTVDLGAIQPLRGVGLRMGAGQAGVEWPTSIQVQVSEDGQRYSAVGNLMQILVTPPPTKGYATHWLVTDKLQTHGRYVKFVCTPLNLGTGAYIMLDEVEVYKGEDAWLSRPLVFPAAPQAWQADWAGITWQDQVASAPPSERPRRLTVVDGARETGTEGPLQAATAGPAGVTFALQGEAGKPRSMSWVAELPAPVDTANCPYVTMTFRAYGLRRTYEPRPLVALQGVNEGSAAGDVTLLEFNQASNDGLSHTLVKRLPAGFTVERLKVAMLTECDSPRFTLERLQFAATAPEVLGTEIIPGGKLAAGLTAVDLGAALRDSLAAWHERVLGKHGLVLDGARALPAGEVTVSGLPFRLATGEKNLAPVPDTPEKNEKVQFLGQTVESRSLGPVSRDDALAIPVDATAREAFLLLALNAPPVQPRGGLPYTALRLDDIECLAVELTYDRGAPETAFPYSLADRGYVIPCRELGAYAVAVDPTRRLKGITLRARQFGMSFAVAGLTLNTGAQAKVAALATVPPAERTTWRPQPAARPVSVQRQGQRLTIGNRYYEYSFDLAQGFALDRVVSRWNAAAPVKVAPGSGLRVRVGDVIYTGRCFRAEVLGTTARTADLRLTSTRPELPLELTVKLTAGDTPELAFAATGRNTGDQPLAAEVCLPALAGVALGGAADTRVFFPQYRNVDTAAEIALRAPYGPEFSVQFMDVYNRAAGVGLMVRTDNREQRMATFALGKDGAGVSGGVQWPAEWNELAPGASRAYPTVSLFAHTGDWHAAFALYRDWVRTWYQPVKTQDEPFFLKAWDLQCYRVSDKLSWREARVPPPIAADRQRHFFDETFEFEKQRLGHVPDLVHFYNWTYGDAKDRNEYGVHGSAWAYQQVGGLEFFRQCVEAIQGKWQTPLSLYTLNDRFRASAVPDQALAQELAAKALYKTLDNDDSAALRGVGKVDGIFYPPFGTERWTDYFVKDITQMQRDTGCQMVYMDVMPRFSNLRGVPGVSPRDDDLNVVQRVREALPDEVGLWTEYPFTDVASQYADGALQYYFLELNETFARPYSGGEASAEAWQRTPFSIARYVLPKYRAVCLPGYIEASNKPNQVDAVFLNGEVFHEDTFRLQYSRPRANINRAYVVKHQYADCFSSDNPTPWVETAAAGLTANFFPGQNRNLWTVCNARPRTYSGVVLSVPHRAGARYRDAWTGKALNPKIVGGKAQLALTLEPQAPGCVVQEWGK